MKSNRGVTVTGLVIYISSFLMICGVIAVISTFFYNNSKFLSSEASASSEFDILNAYLAKEAKTEGNRVDQDSSTDTQMEFSSGNVYEWNRENKVIYFHNSTLNKYFVLCNYINGCSFRKEDNSFTVTVKILEKEYTQEYHFDS